MTGQDLLDKIIEDGTVMPLEKKDSIAKEIDLAIEEDRFHYIEKEGQRIGFLVCKKIGDKMLVGNCVVYKKFRNITSLMTIRNTLRKIYKDIDCFFWKSRKRNKMCYAR